jgi:hypothetical protein
MSLLDTVNAKSELMKQGKMADAAEQYFADTAASVDHNGSKTASRAEMIEKMQGFVGSISAVKEITLHNTAVTGDVSFTEWTFHFDHQDGSTTHWHEIIRSEWQDGKIVNEQYFLA